MTRSYSRAVIDGHPLRAFRLWQFCGRTSPGRTSLETVVESLADEFTVKLQVL